MMPTMGYWREKLGDDSKSDGMEPKVIIESTDLEMAVERDLWDTTRREIRAGSEREKDERNSRQISRWIKEMRRETSSVAWRLTRKERDDGGVSCFLRSFLDSFWFSTADEVEKVGDLFVTRLGEGWGGKEKRPSLE